MPSATFVLSTGRCGTQWLARHLSLQAVPGLLVEHEPLHDGYQPRLILGAGSPSKLEPGVAKVILDHADMIEKHLETGDYIECGHPCWSALPWLAERFKGRFRVVHLVRHPVPTAYSWVTHQAYCPPLAPHLREKVLLSPFDPGVLHPEYQERWPSLTPFEKALYYWTEVNGHGLVWEKSLGLPWLRVTYEAMFGGSGLTAIHDFLGLGDVNADLKAQVDSFHYITHEWQDSSLIANHPPALETARQLGYDPFAFDPDALRRRYLGM